MDRDRDWDWDNNRNRGKERYTNRNGGRNWYGDRDRDEEREDRRRGWTRNRGRRERSQDGMRERDNQNRDFNRDESSDPSYDHNKDDDDDDDDQYWDKERRNRKWERDGERKEHIPERQRRLPSLLQFYEEKQRGTSEQQSPRKLESQINRWEKPSRRASRDDENKHKKPPTPFPVDFPSEFPRKISKTNEQWEEWERERENAFQNLGVQGEEDEEAEEEEEEEEQQQQQQQLMKEEGRKKKAKGKVRRNGAAKPSPESGFIEKDQVPDDPQNRPSLASTHRDLGSGYYILNNREKDEKPRKRSRQESDLQKQEEKRSSKNSYDVLKEEPEDLPVKENGSVLLPVLEENEKAFHELVAGGDVDAVQNFLKKYPDFNINCVNYQKMSALHVAIHEENEEMVKFLLSQRSLDLSDCVLHAIKQENIRIVEMILDEMGQISPGLEFAMTSHSVDFPDDMTALILAAQLGNYEMIDFLIKRGHRIPDVHHPHCKCHVCKSELKNYDRLRYSTMKLNLYKAISNPMYIFHVTDDPFQRAFELTKELQDAATVFPQFKDSYEELWKELRNFTVELIGCCRNSQEVEIVLRKPSDAIEGQVKFPRLQYAIDLNQKEFVSHPYTQAVLADAWTGELLDWKVRSPTMQALSVFPRIPMLPIIAVMCIFLPNHSFVSKWKIPVNKMISSCASYLIFLLLLFLESNQDKSKQKRGPPKSGLEPFIIVYVVGYIWDNVRLCFKIGGKRFFRTMWHIFDCCMLTLFFLTFVFWAASWADVTAYDDVHLPRKYWNSLDPELVAEGLFAVAVIMAFFRLHKILSLNYYLGPLQVSIGKMIMDILRFVNFFGIIILAWCAGLCRFYQPYYGMVQTDPASGNTVAQVPSFVSFSMTLKTLFWAIFGMSPIESADVVIENLPGDTPDTTIINRHEFTEAVGYIAFALFQFLSVVVVLNMLIACMSNTLTKVIDNVTVEWVFGRSQIYLSYMAASILPPPFNLVPTASGIKTLWTWLRLLVKPTKGQKAKCSFTHCCYIESEAEAYISSEFPSLMSELAQRYLRLDEKSKKESSSHESDEFCRNEINEIREILRRVEKNISHE